jgi:hypothetical protein
MTMLSAELMRMAAGLLMGDYDYDRNQLSQEELTSFPKVAETTDWPIKGIMVQIEPCGAARR